MNKLISFSYLARIESPLDVLLPLEYSLSVYVVSAAAALFIVFVLAS
jgi:hypothetical protein